MTNNRTKRPTEVVLAERREKLEAAERALAHRRLMLNDMRYHRAFEAMAALVLVDDVHDPQGVLSAASKFLEDLCDVAVTASLSRNEACKDDGP